MQVHPITITGLIIADIILCLSSAQAQNITTATRCDAALQAAKNQIQKNRRVKVVWTNKSNISQRYKTYPTNRPFLYEFGLTGSATGSILVSDKLLTRITKDIIDKCPSISMVRFGEYQSSNIVSYGLSLNNKVAGFECIDSEITTQLPWGYELCI